MKGCVVGKGAFQSDIDLSNRTDAVSSCDPNLEGEHEAGKSRWCAYSNNKAWI